jgi:hypothetical protein
MENTTKELITTVLLQDEVAQGIHAIRVATGIDGETPPTFTDWLTNAVECADVTVTTDDFTTQEEKQEPIFDEAGYNRAVYNQVKQYLIRLCDTPLNLWLETNQTL